MTYNSRDLIHRYIYLCENQGATTSELANALGLSRKTVAARLNDLYTSGRIQWNGQYRGKHKSRVYLPAPDPCPTCGHSIENDEADTDPETGFPLVSLRNIITGDYRMPDVG